MFKPHLVLTELNAILPTLALIVCLFHFGQALSQSSFNVAYDSKDDCGFSMERLLPLIDEADREMFNTVRVEIAGSTYTRHRDFAKMVTGLHEGDIFTRKALETSVKRISKMKSIYPIKMENVEVRLRKEEKEIDIVVFVKQRPKPKR